MADISSAGIVRMTPGYRSTGGKDVLSGVDVPVVPGAARRARPVPRRQAQRGEQVPARRAGLAARVPAVDHGQRPPVAPCLVLKLAAELSEPGVENGLAQPGFGRRAVAPVAAVAVRPGPGAAGHTGDVQVFDRDQVVVADKTGAGFVEEVAPGVADLAVGAGDLGLRLGPVRAAFLLAGEAALVAGQVPGLALKAARAGDLLAGRQDREVLHAEVRPGGAAGLRRGFRVVCVNGERHVPAAVAL